MNDILMQLQAIVAEQGMLPWLKALLLFVLGAVFGLLDSLSPAREALVFLLVSDFVLGLAHALNQDVFSFRRFWRGARKFFLYAIAIRIMLWVDVATGPLDLPFVGALSFNAALCAWMALGEGFSCLKHLDYFGLRLPWLSERLRHYQTLITTGEYKGPERRRERRDRDRHPEPDHEKGRMYYGDD